MERRRASVLESYSKELGITKRKHSRILHSFGEKLTHYLIITGNEVKLPNKLGTLQVVKVRPSNKLVDYKATKKLYGEYNKQNPNNKKTVLHTNRITKGYIPKLYWGKMQAHFKNKTKYAFNFTRPNIRPNSYNKHNPEVSLIPYFRTEGFRKYEIFNPQLKHIRNYEQLPKKRKTNTSKGYYH